MSSYRSWFAILTLGTNKELYWVGYMMSWLVWKKKKKRLWVSARNPESPPADDTPPSEKLSDSCVHTWRSGSSKRSERSHSSFQLVVFPPAGEYFSFCGCFNRASVLFFRHVLARTPVRLRPLICSALKRFWRQCHHNRASAPRLKGSELDPVILIATVLCHAYISRFKLRYLIK